MRHAEITGLTSTEPEKTCKEILVAIGEGLSHLAISDDGEDEEIGDDDETEQGKLSEDDEPGWVKGTINKTVQQRKARVR
jgi:hypothetical protein